MDGHFPDSLRLMVNAPPYQAHQEEGAYASSLLAELITHQEAILDHQLLIFE
jgi:hypothetical protein